MLPWPAMPQKFPRKHVRSTRRSIITFSILAAVCCLRPYFRCGSVSPRLNVFPMAWQQSAPAAPSDSKVFPGRDRATRARNQCLIEANKEIVERARTHVGNLAHALKTPLSVMVNEATARGDEQFAHKSTRASRHHARSGRPASGARATCCPPDHGRGTVTEVAPVVTALARTMEKIYRDKNIAIATCTLTKKPSFRVNGRTRGDDGQSRRQCLQVGNVARFDQVVREAKIGSDDRRPFASSLMTMVAACLHPSANRLRNAANDWTKRNPVPGLVCRSWSSWPALYGGNLTLDTAPLGGLRAELVLPTA